MAGPRETRFLAALDRLRIEVRREAATQTGLMPGERVLAERLAVSRTTVRRMLAFLVDEGLLVHRHGVGTFAVRSAIPVPSPSPEAPHAPPSWRAGGFTAAVTRLGHIPSSRDVVQVDALPTPEEAMLLACGADEPVLRLNRLRCVDAVPVACETAVLPRWALGPGGRVTGSLYEALATQGTVPIRALLRLRMAVPTDDERRRLGLGSSVALLDTRRADYDAAGRCCALTRTRSRADRFDLLLASSGRDPPFGLAVDDGMGWGGATFA